MPHTYCPLNGKQMFGSRREARLAARNTQLRRRGSPSVYWCTYCNAWHITHFTYAHSKQLRTNPDFDLLIQPPEKERHNDMLILTDNAYVPNGTSIGIKQLNDGGQHLQLIMFDEQDSRLEVQFTYQQALELIEAMKIQLAKMKI